MTHLTEATQTPLAQGPAVSLGLDPSARPDPTDTTGLPDAGAPRRPGAIRRAEGALLIGLMYQRVMRRHKGRP